MHSTPSAPPPACTNPSKPRRARPLTPVEIDLLRTIDRNEDYFDDGTVLLVAPIHCPMADRLVKRGFAVRAFNDNYSAGGAYRITKAGLAAIRSAP